MTSLESESCSSVMTTNDVRVEVYRAFVEDGRASQAKEVSARLRLPLEQVAESLRELADDHVIAFLPGTEDLWLAHPFCAIRVPFEVSAGRRSWDAICIWDALGILALVDSDGQVSTASPECRQPIQVSVADGVVKAPADAFVHFGFQRAVGTRMLVIPERTCGSSGRKKTCGVGWNKAIRQAKGCQSSGCGTWHEPGTAAAIYPPGRGGAPRRPNRCSGASG